MRAADTEIPDTMDAKAASERIWPCSSAAKRVSRHAKYQIRGYNGRWDQAGDKITLSYKNDSLKCISE